MKNKFFCCAAGVLTLLLIIIQTAVAMQEIVTLTSRYDAMSGGANITLSYFFDMPANGDPKTVLLVIPGGNGVINLRTQDGKIRHNLHDNLFIRSRTMLHERSIGLAVPDVPSDFSRGMNVIFRKGREHADDLRAMLKDLRTRYAKSKILFAASGSGGVSALFAAGRFSKEIDGVILAGADSSQLHAYDHSSVKAPVLMLHHAMDSCDSAPIIEAKEIAERYSFSLVPFWGGAPVQDRNRCAFKTKHGFWGLDEKVVEIMGGWIAGPSMSLPHPRNENYFLNEKVSWIPTRGFWGEIQLQTTIYKPDGPGPFPLAIISHGVPFEKVLESEVKSRHRYCLQSEEFVKRGFAVAIPMRRGYGKSGGQKNVSTVNIANFGLEDAKDIQATIDFMRREPYVDGKNIVLVGQSGGGLASLAYGSLENPDVKGIINFAGGLRTKREMWENDMAQAFGIYAKTTRIPSLWIYTENDSYFSPTTVGSAYERYQKNGGQARLIALPPFKRDGHGLFSHFEGGSIWAGEVEKFLSQIGFVRAAERR